MAQNLCDIIFWPIFRGKSRRTNSFSIVPVAFMKVTVAAKGLPFPFDYFRWLMIAKASHPSFQKLYYMLQALVVMLRKECPYWFMNMWMAFMLRHVPRCIHYQTVSYTVGHYFSGSDHFESLQISWVNFSVWLAYKYNHGTIPSKSPDHYPMIFVTACVDHVSKSYLTTIPCDLI